MFKPIHKHLLIKGTAMNTLTDPDQGKQMLRDLVAAIRMTPVTPAQCIYVSDEGNEGLTGSINLATSHIAFHFWDKEKLLMADVYSCKNFDASVVTKVLNAYFEGFTEYGLLLIDREKDI